jgi:hypothetical protein
MTFSPSGSAHPAITDTAYANPNQIAADTQPRGTAPNSQPPNDKAPHINFKLTAPTHPTRSSRRNACTKHKTPTTTHTPAHHHNGATPATHTYKGAARVVASGAHNDAAITTSSAPKNNNIRPRFPTNTAATPIAKPPPKGGEPHDTCPHPTAIKHQ